MIAQQKGYIHRKFEIESGDPDDAFFKDGFVFFVEIKYGNDTVKLHQSKKHRLWRLCGFLVYIVTDNSQWDLIFKEVDELRIKGLSEAITNQLLCN